MTKHGRLIFNVAVMLMPLTSASAAAYAQDTSGSACPGARVFEPGVISTEQWEWRLTFSPNRRRAFWSTSTGWWPGTRERAEIKTSRRMRNGDWTAPRVASFSGNHADMDPFVSPDGTRIYFSSMRPVEGAERLDMDLWVVELAGAGAQEPMHIAAASSDGYDELYPSVDAEGHLYFARVRAPEPSEDVDIWRSMRQPDGSYGTPEKLGAGINSPERWEFNPEISPDGATLLFVRLDRPDDPLPDLGHGLGDIYVSRLVEGQFADAQNLGPCVNTSSDEFHPTVLWERDLLFFARDAGAPSDFYITRLRLPD